MNEQIKKLYLVVKVILNFEILGKLLILIELIAIPLGIYAIYQGSIAIRLQADSNEQQVISTAWQQLTTPAAGNTGKANAIKILASKGVELVNLRLDCEAMGSHYKADELFTDTKRCVGAPFMSDLSLSYPFPKSINGVNFNGNSMSKIYLKGMVLYGLSIKYSEIHDLKIIDSNIYDMDVSGSRLMLVEFDGTTSMEGGVDEAFVGKAIDGIVAQFSRFNRVTFKLAALNGADFTGAKFSDVKFELKSIENWNVSGVDFCWEPLLEDYYDEETPEDYCAKGLNIEHFQNMWAWQDNPPKGMGIVGALLSDVKLCPTSLREKYYKDIVQSAFPWVLNRGYTKPEGC